MNEVTEWETVKSRDYQAASMEQGSETTRSSGNSVLTDLGCIRPEALEVIASASLKVYVGKLRPGEEQEFAGRHSKFVTMLE